MATLWNTRARFLKGRVLILTSYPETYDSVNGSITGRIFLIHLLSLDVSSWYKMSADFYSRDFLIPWEILCTCSIIECLSLNLMIQNKIYPILKWLYHVLIYPKTVQKQWNWSVRQNWKCKTIRRWFVSTAYIK